MTTTSTAFRSTTTPNTGIAQPAAAGLSSTFGVGSARGRNEKPSGDAFPSGSAGGPSTTFAESTYVGYDNGQWTQTANPSSFATVPSHHGSIIADSIYPTGGAFSTVSYDNGQWTTGPASTLLPAAQATSVSTGAPLSTATTTVTTLPPGAVIPSAANSHIASCMLLLPLFIISMILSQAN